jgi:hemin uptake protein HemP
MCQGIAPARVVRSEELLLGQRELFILHGGQVYRLLRTRNDKLILQK